MNKAILSIDLLSHERELVSLELLERLDRDTDESALELTFVDSL